MIDQNHDPEMDDLRENALIQTGLEFLSAMGQYYGSEKALELWDQLRSTVGEDLAGSIFMAMITGGGPRNVLVSANNPVLKINAIKEVRSVSGMGLKEAKDFVEATELRPMQLTLNRDASMSNFIKSMRLAGYKVY